MFDLIISTILLLVNLRSGLVVGQMGTEEGGRCLLDISEAKAET